MLKSLAVFTVLCNDGSSIDIVTEPVSSSLLACIFIASADWLIVDMIAPLSVLFATVVLSPLTVAVISVTLLLALFAVVSTADILLLKPSTVALTSFALVRALPAVLVADVIRASKPLIVCSNVEVLSDTVLMDASISSGAGVHVGALSPSTKIRLWYHTISPISQVVVLG